MGLLNRLARPGCQIVAIAQLVDALLPLPARQTFKRHISKTFKLSDLTAQVHAYLSILSRRQEELRAG